jgi:hypothetical protein
MIVLRQLRWVKRMNEFLLALSAFVVGWALGYWRGCDSLHRTKIGEEE